MRRPVITLYCVCVCELDVHRGSLPLYAAPGSAVQHKLYEYDLTKLCAGPPRRALSLISLGEMVNNYYQFFFFTCSRLFFFLLYPPSVYSLRQLFFLYIRIWSPHPFPFYFFFLLYTLLGYIVCPSIQFPYAISSRFYNYSRTVATARRGRRKKRVYSSI